eukprot:scaffold3761_cov372-Prasinococcus_capsulatus_cf.AAC.7
MGRAKAAPPPRPSLPPRPLRAWQADKTPEWLPQVPRLAPLAAPDGVPGWGDREPALLVLPHVSAAERRSSLQVVVNAMSWHRLLEAHPREVRLQRGAQEALGGLARSAAFVAVRMGGPVGLHRQCAELPSTTHPRVAPAVKP